jgi:hypothetical protein
MHTRQVYVTMQPLLFLTVALDIIYHLAVTTVCITNTLASTHGGAKLQRPGTTAVHE